MKFTLVIPVAPERGAEIIESIKELDYPKSEFHVVVVRGLNPSDNRNKGASRALGEYIVFLDDDAKIEKDYLLKIEDFFNRHPEVDVVGGPQLTPEDDRGFAKVSGYALSSFFGAWTLMSRYSATKEMIDVDETVITSANLICRKEVLEEVKFDSNLFPGEDPKFISDVKKAGFIVGYNPQIRIFHRRRADIKSLIKQIYYYGKVRPEKENFIETLSRPFFLVPSLFVIYLFLLILSVFINPVLTGGVIGVVGEDVGGYLRFFWVFPILLYIILILLFGLYDSSKNGNVKAFLVLPSIYPLIHISYGVGMIYGYFKKVFK